MLPTYRPNAHVVVELITQMNYPSPKMNYFLNSSNLSQVVKGIPSLNERVFVGMGEGIGSGSFSNYPRGYWGATVVACDAETEEWVLRFDETYGSIWDADWQFDDPPESDLQFERTGREMVFYGQIEEDDEIPIYVPN